MRRKVQANKKNVYEISKFINTESSVLLKFWFVWSFCFLVLFWVFVVIVAVVLRQSLLKSRLPLNSLCCQQWLWTSDPLVSLQLLSSGITHLHHKACLWQCSGSTPGWIPEPWTTQPLLPTLNILRPINHILGAMTNLNINYVRSTSFWARGTGENLGS